MAIIKCIHSNKAIILHTQNRIGRNQKVSTIHIAESDISQSHAVIEWKNGDWYLQDCSRNGTLISKKYLHHASTKLKENDIIQFGKDESTKYQIVNLNPPVSYLISLSNPDTIMELGNFEKITDDQNEEILFYYSSNMSWKAETVSYSIEFEHEKKYRLNNEDWLFIENEPLNATVDTRNLVDQAEFQFKISEDEESVHVNIMIDGLELNLGERSHHHLLLILARKRFSDSKEDLPTNNDGWVNVDGLVSQLSKELYKSVDEYYINILIHRFRKQLFGLKPYGYLFSEVIERKKGKIRFAHPLFNISKESQLSIA
ncbi:FHA domain-containing protein [Tenacibaculum sp. MAR_2009_124]|uniref:FHA domain-containing protein n=1 Tax=Tenacibaculum sp. MAR_2009_124 TaxID=1250059 RepID=UPI0008990C91|nr:FHA domain-containing protein [Tenacibaculum sp. MAR_2009_124]SED15481.1 FHA domain-containing protein [Tenacibaculum sp. MAR_2009_124]